MFNFVILGLICTHFKLRLTKFQPKGEHSFQLLNQVFQQNSRKLTDFQKNDNNIEEGLNLDTREK